MRTGRPTSEKKDNVVRIRVSDIMANKLDQKAKARGISISELVREIISRNI